MKANDSEKKQIQDFMGLFYKIVLNTYSVEDSDKYWDELLSACSYTEKKNDFEFAKAMLIAYVNWQDLRSKNYTRVDGITIPITQIAEPDPWVFRK